MSCCYDSEPAACYRVSLRVARKPHACCECRRTIAPGDRYEYASGVWEGQPSSFHTCEACTILREHVQAEKNCGCFEFTSLLADAAESAHEAGAAA